MRTISEQELKDILDKHGKWLRNEDRTAWRISRMLGFEYWVSRRGSVASAFHPCGSLRSTPRILKLRRSKNGYQTMAFRGVNKLVHRLVADEFVAEVKGMVVHHKDADRLNNVASNLEVTNTNRNNSAGHVTRKLNKKMITESIRYYRREEPKP